MIQITKHSSYEADEHTKLTDILKETVNLDNFEERKSMYNTCLWWGIWRCRMQMKLFKSEEPTYNEIFKITMIH